MAVTGFTGLFAALERLAGVEAELPALGQDLAAQMAEAMKNELGTYQEGWPALLAATQQEREREGYTPDDPLLRAGTMQEAITAWQGADGAWEAGIPADDPTIDYATAQEFGTLGGTVVPPRPFVGPIARDYGQKAVDGVAVTVEQAL